MTTYRRRPAEIEAIQWTGTNIAELRAFAGSDFDTIDPEDRIEDRDQDAQLLVEASHWVGIGPGDWVLKFEGYFVSKRDETFRAVWEPASVPSAPTQTADADRRDRYADAIRDRVRFRLGASVLALAQQGRPLKMSFGEAETAADAAIAVADAEQATTRAAALREAADAPAAECSAQHRTLDDGRLCIRAAQHRGDHIDERGFHWSDTVAVYPVSDGTFRAGTDVRAALALAAVPAAVEEQPTKPDRCPHGCDTSICPCLACEADEEQQPETQARRACTNCGHFTCDGNGPCGAIVSLSAVSDEKRCTCTGLAVEEQPDTNTPEAVAHPPAHAWKVESPRRDKWTSWGATYDERVWAAASYEDVIAVAPQRPFRLVRATTTYAVEAEHTPAVVPQPEEATAEQTGWMGATELASDHEIAARAATGIVGYRQDNGRLLHCPAHKPAPASRHIDFHEVTADDLPDGGICVHPRCGRDLLAAWPASPGKET